MVLAQKGEQFTGAIIYGIETEGGAATVPAVEREVTALTPGGVISTDHALAPVSAKADRSLKPISFALGVFGAIAVLAALLIAAQLMARRFREEAGDLLVLRALGAGPADTVLDGLVGMVAAILAASVLAAVIAIGLSPLAPLEPSGRCTRPGGSRSTGRSWASVSCALRAPARDRTSPGLRHRTAPRRTAAPDPFDDRSPGGGGAVRSRPLGPRCRRGADGAGTGRGPQPVPVRSALLGSVLAVALVVTTLTFGSSLQTLVSSPALYGWNWTYILNPVEREVATCRMSPSRC